MPKTFDPGIIQGSRCYEIWEAELRKLPALFKESLAHHRKICDCKTEREKQTCFRKRFQDYLEPYPPEFAGMKLAILNESFGGETADNIYAPDNKLQYARDLQALLRFEMERLQIEAKEKENA